MSNLLSIFKNGSSLPAHIQKNELNATTKALMGNFETRRISIRGGAFRKVINGQEVGKIQDRYINVVIVGVAEHTSRQFYQATYVEGVVAAPDCYSADGITPDSRALHIQSSTCATCPQNFSGSGQGGSKACRFQRRIAVVLENELMDGNVYEMTLAATSLFGRGTGDIEKMSMQQYARFLGGYGVNIDAIVTELRFDLDAATPKLLFSAVRPLNIDELERVSEYANSPETLAAITYNFGGVMIPPVELPFTQPQVQRSAPQAPQAPAPQAQPEPEPAPVMPVRTRAPRGTRTPPPVLPATEIIPEPVRREAKPAPQASTDINSILEEWGDE